MNYLGHLWLAERTQTSAAGAVLGDFIKGPELGHLPVALRLGVRLHRRVDSFGDQHPITAALRRQAPPGLRRYAGILLDLGFDHLLAVQWHEFHSQALAEFAAHAQCALADHQHWFPQPMRGRLDRFAELLCSYAKPAGLSYALKRTARRLSRPYDSAAAQHWLTEIQPQLHHQLPPLLADLVEEMNRLPG